MSNLISLISLNRLKWWPVRQGRYSEIFMVNRSICQVVNSTDVEPVPNGTLQFSTLVEGRLLIFSWLVGWSVSQQDFSKTALRIFLIFCMNLLYHKGKKRTRPFVRENSGSLIIHEKVSKIMVFGHFFQDYWWDLPKNAHEYSLDGSLWHCIGCWVSSSLEVRYFAYWLSQYA